MEIIAQDEDILMNITDEDLPILAKMYEPHQHWAPFVYSMINTGIKWRKENKEVVSFMSPNGSWRKDGTFVAVMNYGWHHIFIFTLDNSGKNAIDCILKTKRLTCNKPLPMHTVFFNVHPNLHPHLTTALESHNYKIKYGEDKDSCYIMYYINKDKALKLNVECPSDVYIKKLDPTMVPTVARYYPSKYPDPEKFLETLIIMNGCYGLFLKLNDELVSWVLRSCLGQLAILQTSDEHLKKGYGSLVAKYTIIQIAKDGFHPYSAVGINNKPSQYLFEKLGFQNIGVCKFFGVRL